MRTPLIYTPASRSLATKHPKGFVPPTEDELLELRERVQEFTSM
jgi:isovaleryl-CoA dehydrogenase